MTLIGMGDQAVLTPNGITHRVRINRRGILSDMTSCGILWRVTCEWLPQEREVDCMACIAEEALP